MTDKFTWRATTDSSGEGDFRVTQSSFGDGYSQEIPLGLNNEKQKWSVTVTGYKTYVLGALDFIRARKGGVSFFWTPPCGVQGYYKCKKYNLKDQGGAYFVLSMEFEQAFMP